MNQELSYQANLVLEFEDTVLITKSGCINLTKWSKNYIIVDKIDSNL